MAASWPDGGPPRFWERPLGLGHSAIVVDDGRLFTMYRHGKQVSRKGPWEAREAVIALDAATGKTLWEQDTIICQAGGPGQAVIALRQKDGSVAWRSGDFLTAEAAPILIEVEGQTQLVVLGGQTVNGLDPDSGTILWTHPHDTSGDMNNSTPVWGPDNILFVTSAYDQGSRALRLSRKGPATTVEELWFTNRFRLMFTNGIRIDRHLYGTSGDFGPAFLGAIDVRTGELAWQERGFARGNLIHADGKLVILDEDGQLAIVEVSPAGLNRLASTRIFTTTAWTVPTLVGTTLYARDRERILALNLGTP